MAPKRARDADAVLETDRAAADELLSSAFAAGVRHRCLSSLCA